MEREGERREDGEPERGGGGDRVRRRVGDKEI